MLEPLSESKPNEPLLKVDNLSVSFRQGDSVNEVVKDVSFSLHKGQTLALVGESGSGKSVTAHAILKLLPYPMAFHPSGQIVFQGEQILSKSAAQMRALRGSRISMIFQEPMTALNPLHTIEKQISEVLMQHRGLSRTQARPHVIELLQQVQIPQPEARLKSYPHELSGGQRQRVMIAMALANEPELLIADEPTTALDVTVQREILLLLKKIQQERQLSMLLITHDLGVVKAMADTVAVMKLGELLEGGPCNDVFDNPQHAYTRMLIDSEPKGGPVAITTPSETAIEARELQVRFATKKNFWGKATQWFDAVNRVSFELREGETLGIVGESGSGKSTLALAVLRLLESSGDVMFQNQNIADLSGKPLKQLRSRLQVVFQDPFASLSPRMTMADIIEEGLLVHHQYSAQQREQAVIKVIQEVGLDPDHRHRYPHEFSGGQRQRIAIARALILNPQVVILDEPTSALDKAVQAQVLNLLKELQRSRGLSYLFISHDLKVVRSISHNILVMKEGQVVEAGDAETILTQPGHVYTQTLLAASY